MVKWSVSRGIALTLATILAICGGWLLLAPTTVGGPVSLVVTSGVSMQPAFHTGDLAVLRKSSTYHVGDVVGYHSRTLRGAVVMHRLVAADGGRWTTKGDHNAWLDPDHPTNADIVGKLSLHIPKGGFLLTRVFLPLALVGFVCLLLPWKRRSRDEDGDVEAPPTAPCSPSESDAARARHTGHRSPASRGANRVPDYLSRQICVRLIAGGLAIVILGALTALIAYSLPLHRTATVAQKSVTTVRFGWTGTSDNRLIYPDGRVTDPAPIFPKVVDRVTMTADVTTDGRPARAATLNATLSDASGWTRQWQLDSTGETSGSSLHLSQNVNLSLLLMQVAWVQSTTGVSSPATLTLSVDEKGGPPDAPALSFALSKVAVKPQGALNVTSSGTTPTRTSVPATLSISGKNFSIGRLRTLGAGAAALGLIVALAAGLLCRRTRTPSALDRLLRLFAGRVVHLTSAAPWEQSCLDVSDISSLAALAATPSAVLYVVDVGEHQLLIAERGATRLRCRLTNDPGTPAAASAETTVEETVEATTEAVPSSPALPVQRSSGAPESATNEFDAGRF
jgi:signal peptidase I